jgi:hypothetical protein
MYIGMYLYLSWDLKDVKKYHTHFLKTVDFFSFFLVADWFFISAVVVYSDYVETST